MKQSLVIIDCQNDFRRDQSPYACQMLDARLIGRIKNLLTFARERGLAVVYTQHSIKPNKSNAEFGESEEVRACIIGTPGWEIIDDLKPHPKDHIIQKDKYDAFLNTDLEKVLKDLKTDTIILAGVLTNNCVRATAEGAHYRNFKLLIVSDCCGATSYIKNRTNEEIHEITLKDLEGRIYETEIISLSKLKNKQ